MRLTQVLVLRRKELLLLEEPAAGGLLSELRRVGVERVLVPELQLLSVVAWWHGVKLKMHSVVGDLYL